MVPTLNIFMFSCLLMYLGCCRQNLGVADTIDDRVHPLTEPALGYSSQPVKPTSAVWNRKPTNKRRSINPLA